MYQQDNENNKSHDIVTIIKILNQTRAFQPQMISNSLQRMCIIYQYKYHKSQEKRRGRVSKIFWFRQKSQVTSKENSWVKNEAHEREWTQKLKHPNSWVSYWSMKFVSREQTRPIFNNCAIATEKKQGFKCRDIISYSYENDYICP